MERNPEDDSTLVICLDPEGVDVSCGKLDPSIGGRRCDVAIGWVEGRERVGEAYGHDIITEQESSIIYEWRGVLERQCMTIDSRFHTH